MPICDSIQIAAAFSRLRQPPTSRNGSLELPVIVGDPLGLIRAVGDANRLVWHDALRFNAPLRNAAR